jgi:hypothetical protein
MPGARDPAKAYRTRKIAPGTICFFFRTANKAPMIPRTKASRKLDSMLRIYDQKATLTSLLFALTILKMKIKAAGFFRPDHDPPQNTIAAWLS